MFSLKTLSLAGFEPGSSVPDAMSTAPRRQGSESFYNIGFSRGAWTRAAQPWSSRGRWRPFLATPLVMTSKFSWYQMLFGRIGFMYKNTLKRYKVALSICK
jgi:hypothetical protein